MKRARYEPIGEAPQQPRSRLLRLGVAALAVAGVKLSSALVSTDATPLAVFADRGDHSNHSHNHTRNGTGPHGNATNVTTPALPPADRGNTTIDRGASRDTVIGEGSKIDNLVQIGHNCVVGRHCVICAQVGMAGIGANPLWGFGGYAGPMLFPGAPGGQLMTASGMAALGAMHQQVD